jgi:SAM-dependent MidA family methyltransferase
LQIADCRLIEEVIRERGPLTVAAFMELALYSENGYYARASRRSGRAGDFFTSVDVGPLFGELLAVQIAEMVEILAGRGTGLRTTRGDLSPVLVEAGAGDGRLSADILRSLQRSAPDVLGRLRLHLVETSPAARAAQRATLGDVADRLASSSAELPESFEGIVVANELLDAMPVHQVVMRDDGLREIYVDAATQRDPERVALRTIEGPPSTPALAEYFARAGVSLEPGWRAEINLAAIEWIRTAARRLRRGFMILIDYGHEARELYSITHARGTLTTFAGHTMRGSESPGAPAWLASPGGRDITAHVDFTSVRAAAEREGMTTIGFLDQTYFLIALANLENPQNLENPENPENLKRRFELKTLLLPGGLGSTHKVLLLGKGVGSPALRGCSYRVRVT